MVNCPFCENSLTEGSMDIDIFLEGKKIGTVTDVPVIMCEKCTFDAVLLEAKVTPTGIYFGKGVKDGESA